MTQDAVTKAMAPSNERLGKIEGTLRNIEGTLDATVSVLGSIRDSLRNLEGGIGALKTGMDSLKASLNDVNTTLAKMAGNGKEEPPQGSR